MKNTGRCPKCGGTDIWVSYGTFGSEPSHRIAAGLFDIVYVDHHCCTNCGYVEWWVPDTDKLKRRKEDEG